MIQPQKLPTSLDELGKYKVILLSNFLSNLLSDEQMISLQVFVSNRAGGLIFLGGRNSYSLGGYKGSLLEPLLPVKLEPPPRPQRPPIVFVLLMDSSGSMATGGKVEPITLAKEAAMRAVETLKAQDYIGMEAFSEIPGWVTHLRPLGDGLALRQVLDQISTVDAGGGTRMYYAMQEALKDLASLPAGAPASRHVLILSDGDSADGNPADFAALARQFYDDQHATVSTIALGDSIKQEVMSSIAAEGKGRFYVAKTAADLPKIMIAESQAGRGENIQTGQSMLKAGIPNHPLLSGLSEKDLPVLWGYNAQASKKEDGAEDILVSGEYADPILSAWQYGLGRVVAWMSDAGQEWRGAWADPARETSFWLQVIRYSLPNPAIGPAQAEVKLSDTTLTVSASLQTGAGQPLDLAQVVFSYTGADGKLLSLAIPQAAPGLYRLETARPAPGAYRGLVTFQSGTEARQEIALPFAVDAPAEWLPGAVGTGPAALASWAKISGT
ncbi:MAG TPA: VWA domain-containing protein, partial [Polyangia bacterium]